MNWQVLAVWVVVGVTVMSVVAPRVVAAQAVGANVVASGAELVKLADGFSFTEGPAVDRRGDVYFTDQPNDKIWRWDARRGELTEFLTGGGRANGMYFDARGDLIVAADEFNELRRVARGGDYSTLIRKFEGKEFNGPNDVWVHPVSGDIYFTDPLYARDYWTHRGPESQLDGEWVYLLRAGDVAGASAASGASGALGASGASGGDAVAVRVETELRKPNGLVGTPDGKILYVADIGANKTYAYDIAADGSLDNKRLFAPLGSDGMTIDSRGNVYVTGRGVTVFDPSGARIAHIDVPAGWTSNVVFGGRDRRTLFITAMDGLYSIRMAVRGVK